MTVALAARPTACTQARWERNLVNKELIRFSLFKSFICVSSVFPFPSFQSTGCPPLFYADCCFLRLVLLYRPKHWCLHIGCSSRFCSFGFFSGCLNTALKTFLGIALPLKVNLLFCSTFVCTHGDTRAISWLPGCVFKLFLSLIILFLHIICHFLSLSMFSE